MCPHLLNNLPQFKGTFCDSNLRNILTITISSGRWRERGGKIILSFKYEPLLFYTLFFLEKELHAFLYPQYLVTIWNRIQYSPFRKYLLGIQCTPDTFLGSSEKSLHLRLISQSLHSSWESLHHTMNEEYVIYSSYMKSLITKKESERERESKEVSTIIWD